MRVSKLFSNWDQVRRDLIITIDRFEKAELAYVPYPNSWSVGEIILHIASAEEGWFQYVVNRKYNQWPDDFRIEEYPSKELLKARLDEVHQRTIELLDSLAVEDLEKRIDFPWNGSGSLGWIIWHVLEHEIHHRGELSMIHGLLGREGLDV
jgi:uncharacterized damage-inducible protein DinB